MWVFDLKGRLVNLSFVYAIYIVERSGPEEPSWVLTAEWQDPERVPAPLSIHASLKSAQDQLATFAQRLNQGHRCLYIPGTI